MKVKSESEVSQLCPTLAILWTAAYQAPPSMGFSKQKYWSGVPFPSPRDLPDPGIKPVSLMSPALAGVFFTTSATREALTCYRVSRQAYTKIRIEEIAL